MPLHTSPSPAHCPIHASTTSRNQPHRALAIPRFRNHSFHDANHPLPSPVRIGLPHIGRFSERYKDTSEPVFPAELMLAKPSAVSIVGETVTWHCPTSLAELLRLKAAHPEARIVAGNTEVR